MPMFLIERQFADVLELDGAVVAGVKSANSERADSKLKR